MQSALRKDAALSAVDEQRHIREAVEAENAANIAKMAEHEAAVSLLLLFPIYLVTWRITTLPCSVIYLPILILQGL